MVGFCQKSIDILAGLFASVVLFAGPLKTSELVLRYSPFDFTVFSVLLALIFGSISSVLRCNRGKFVKFGNSNIVISLVVLFLYCFFSFLMSPSRVEGLIKLRGLFGVGFGMLLVGAQGGERGTWLGGFILGCFSIAIFLLWVMKAGVMGGGATREIEMLENYLFIGHFFSILAAMALYGITLVQAGWYSRCFAALALLFSAAVFVIAARGPFVSVVLAWVLFIVWFIRRNGWVGGGFRVLLGAVLVLSIFYLMDPQVIELLFGRGAARFGVIVDSPGLGDSAGTRVHYLFPRAIEGFQTHPVFGIGFGAFGVFLGWGDVRAYPHNFILEVLCELGVMGVVLWAWFIGCLWFAWRRARKALPVVGCLAATVGFMVLIQAMFSGDQADNRSLLFVAGLLAACRPSCKTSSVIPTAAPDGKLKGDVA